ncbi:hypothetical protein [Absidia glauca]|uniref:DBF4-type domain-containing protein n=1 Tax=Absidia glauca TaxID=4829 RepID=A0A168N453_ABSGL|nr:hypothetical protein [Absidia glauca]
MHDEAQRLQGALSSQGSRLVALTENLVDRVRGDTRPPRPTNPIQIHDIQYAGKTHNTKLTELMANVAGRGYGGTVISALDEIAWLLNLRGSDIHCCPVFFSYCVVTPEKTVLYVKDNSDGTRLAPLREYLSLANIDIRDYDQLTSDLSQMKNKDKKWLVDPQTTNLSIAQALGDGVEFGTSMIPLAKAIKNPTELASTAMCHQRDGAAVSQHFAWLAHELGNSATIREYDAAQHLESMRQQHKDYVGLAFDTIAATGAHGAIIHYQPSPTDSSIIDPRQLYLCDSGAHYRDGTTDITRTYLFSGQPTDFEKRAFTRVLQAHIALDQAIFPANTTGYQLDAIARQPLWRDGLNYRHGTGHGVGAYLNVHEGPHSISQYSHNKVPLQENMLVTNEPGYYQDGEFGIRIENVLAVCQAPTAHQFDGSYLGFKHLTFVPLGKKLIDTGLLNNTELEWIDHYHQECRHILEPLLQGDRQTLTHLMRHYVPKKTLGEVSTNTTTGTTSTSTSTKMSTTDRRINPEQWMKSNRKGFVGFKMYLDSLDDKTNNSLARKIALLGGNCEVFLNQKCTHLITGKPFYEDPPTKDNDGNQENAPSGAAIDDAKAMTVRKTPYVAKDPSQQAFFDVAHTLNLQVWSVPKAFCVISALLNKSSVPGLSSNRGGGTAIENLDKMLMEEKRYGVNTGQRNGQAPRPIFIPFNEHYIKVDDVTGVHCPILVKQYKSPTFDPATPVQDRLYPWPKLYVKTDPLARSPFVFPNPIHPSAKKTADDIGGQPSPSQNQEQQQQIPRKDLDSFATPTPAATKHNQPNYDTPADQHPQDDNHEPSPSPFVDTIGPASLDRSHMSSRTPLSTTLTTSNYSQPSKSASTTLTNATAVALNTSDKPAFHRSGPPLSENMSRLGRRMVSNQRRDTTTTTKQVAKELRSAVLAKTAHDQAERRKKELVRRTARDQSKYCENCGTCYIELEKHQQEESHQAFVRDKNNFKDLDFVLESTRRTRL